MSHSFYDRICAVRLTAAVLYDRGAALGRSQEELAEDLKPLNKQYLQIVKEGVANDLAGVIAAIKALENDARAHEATAKALLDKAANTQEHAEKLRNFLAEDLKAKGATERTQGDFFITLIDGKLALR